MKPVATGPGATALMRTPRGASSRASTSVSTTTPALALAYAEIRSGGFGPPIPPPERLTMEPPPATASRGAKAAQHDAVPRRSMVTAARHVFASTWSMRPTGPSTPAQFTNPATSPTSLANAASATTEPWSATSVGHT